MSVLPTYTPPLDLSSVQNILTTMAGGGILGAIIVILMIVMRMCKDRRIKTHSGCIDFEMGSVESFRYPPRRTGTTAPPSTPDDQRPTVIVGSGAVPA